MSSGSLSTCSWRAGLPRDPVSTSTFTSGSLSTGYSSSASLPNGGAPPDLGSGAPSGSGRLAPAGPLELSPSFSPQMFDSLSFSPERDSSLLIRKNPLSNSTVAVSVPRLMALLTQHDVLDYSQMLDFFLCYRTYLSPGDLLNYLLARFSWALHYHVCNSHTNEIGRDVAVRTFVVLRHWMLNFFPDDFVPRFQLRSQFCIGLNKLYNWFRQNTSSGDPASYTAISRIFEQLKRSWLRLCGMYWPTDTPTDPHILALPLSPGGVFGGILQIQRSFAPENRRSTLLAFYQESARPILSDEDLLLTSHLDKENLPLLNGTIINGGIPLTHNVTVNPLPAITDININSPNNDLHLHQFYLEPSNVPSSAVPTTAAENQPQNQKTSSLNPKRSFMSRFWHKVKLSDSSTSLYSKSSSVALAHHAQDEMPWNSSLIPPDSIDLLSQHVVDQLADLLKSNDPSPAHLDQDNRRSFVDSLCIQKHLAQSNDGLSFDHDSNPLTEDLDVIFDEQSSINMPPASSSTSRSGSVVNPRSSSSSSEFISGSDNSSISYDESESNLVDEPQMEYHPPYTSSQSFESFSTIGSVGTTVPSRGLRRQVHLQNIHHHTKPHGDDDESDLNETAISDTTPNLASHGFSIVTVGSIGTSLDTGSSSMSLSDQFEADSDQESVSQPKDPFPPGVDPDAAAELAAIPDDTPEDDAIRTALEKLEGVYTKRSRSSNIADNSFLGNSVIRDPRYVDLCSETDLLKYNHDGGPLNKKHPEEQLTPSESFKLYGSINVSSSESHNSHLYDAAFQSRFNIAQLNESPLVEQEGSSSGTSSPDLDQYEDASESIEDILADAPRVMSSVPIHSPPTDRVEPTRTSISSGIHQYTTSSDSSINVDSIGYKLEDDAERCSIIQGESRAPSPEDADLSSFVKQAATSNHVPFILFYDVEAICNQLALIERDALAEVDWNELVELNWNKKLQPVQSWLTMLLERRYTGIDLAISRFNLVVNWVKSEIVLSRDVQIRAATISRFIQIAQRAREMQNYATMMQLVLGLSSDLIQNKMNDLTWQRVPHADVATLQELDSLISPLKNFQNLRQEVNNMEPEKGCTPFVGIYLSDLTSNEERPSYLDSGNNMLNLDKIRTSATIVRSLLQCIEWSSTNGQYKLDTELLSKCLYIHSLTVEEMDQCVAYINSM